MKVFLFSLVCLLLFSSIAVGQLEECPAEGTCYLPHPDCTIFIVCINGEASFVNCPQPLYYNPRTEHCEFPENVPECIGGTRPPVIGTTTEKTTQTTAQPPPDTLTKCGQVIHASAGFIEYKLNQQYSAGELCVFVIQLVESYNCDFTLLSHGIKNFTADTISVIRNIDTLTNEDLPTTRLETVGSPVALGNVNFIVVFKTTTDHGTGFRLQFQGGSDSPYPPIPGLNMAFNNRTENPLRFPLLSDEMESDTIVITPGAKYLTEPNLELRILDDFIGSSCYFDYYRVHSFEGSIAEFQGRLCGTVGRKNTTEFWTKRLFIVVFSKSCLSTEDYMGMLDWYEFP